MINTLADLVLMHGGYDMTSRASYSPGAFSVANPDREFLRLLRGGSTDSWSGEEVDEQGALACGTVLACVRVLSEAVAMCPARVFEERRNGDIEPAFSHPAQRMIYTQPNPEQTPFEFFEMAMANLCLWGNFYAQMVSDGKGYVRQLWPLRPDWMTVERTDRNGPKVYRYQRPDSSAPRLFTDSEVMHVPGMGFDGLRGYSLIELQRNQIGSALSADRFAARMWRNGVKPSGILMVPGKLGGKASDNLQRSFESQYAGDNGAQRTILLEEGVKWIQTTIPPNDAQFLETRQFNRSEIAGWMKVPPHMIGDLSRSTNNNIEHQSLDFTKHSVAPWVTRIEQRLAYALFGPIELGRYFISMDMDELNRGDAKSMAEATRTLVDGGIATYSEGRRRHSMNPVPAGEMFVRPLNQSYVTPDGSIVEALQPEPPAAPAPSEPAKQ